MGEVTQTSIAEGPAGAGPGLGHDAARGGGAGEGV